MLRLIPSSAFADCSSPGSIVCGTRPSAAGPKNADAIPNSASQAMNAASVMWCVSSIAAMKRLHRGAQDVAAEHDRAPREPVGDDAAGEREDDARDRERREHAAERGRRAVDREHGERERDRDDRVADRGCDAAEPEQPEAALAQRACGFAQVAHRR